MSGKTPSLGAGEPIEENPGVGGFELRDGQGYLKRQLGLRASSVELPTFKGRLTRKEDYEGGRTKEDGWACLGGEYLASEEGGV